MFEREIRTLAFVPRWAIIRTNRQQNVAEHSFFVAIYADQIASMIGWMGRRDVLFRLSLYHDLDETLTGDIVAPAKRVMAEAAQTGWNLVEKWLDQTMQNRISTYKAWARPEAKDIEEMEKILAVADILEAVLYLADEEFSGNKNCLSVRIHCMALLNNAIDKLPAFPELRAKVHSTCHAAIGQALGVCDPVVTGKERVI